MGSLIYDYEVPVPDGKVGDWKVERKTVTKRKADFGAMRACFGGFGRYTPAGTYVGLLHKETLVMSDTPDERRDLETPVYEARGDVLINGLGLGLITGCVLEKEEVDQVTVVEISPDVIELVGTHYLKKYGSRLEIIQADALEYKPPKNQRFGMVWHDIWNDICSDHLPDMHRLHRKYGRRCDWQGSWCRYLMERQ